MEGQRLEAWLQGAEGWKSGRGGSSVDASYALLRYGGGSGNSEGGSNGSDRRGGWQGLGAEGRCNRGVMTRLGAGNERRKEDGREDRNRGGWRRKRRSRERAAAT
ncbi:hypothetical protein BHE74_00023341 [Ensete ventricosum]|nr:hypothetical protein GW17_00029426 [Ensete ventricosum]RWW69087.1 hypothetical protein BHE74_00023341 [Ensete ventricosum]